MKNRHPEIEEFRFSFEKTFKNAEHVLDANSEKLMSYFGPVSMGDDLYSSLAVADGKSAEAVLSDNQPVTVTQGNWRSLIMKTKDASDRKKIFEALYQTGRYTRCQGRNFGRRR